MNRNVILVFLKFIGFQIWGQGGDYGCVSVSFFEIFAGLQELF